MEDLFAGEGCLVVGVGVLGGPGAGADDEVGELFLGDAGAAEEGLGLEGGGGEVVEADGAREEGVKGEVGDRVAAGALGFFGVADDDDDVVVSGEDVGSGVVDGLGAVCGGLLLALEMRADDVGHGAVGDGARVEEVVGAGDGGLNLACAEGEAGLRADLLDDLEGHALHALIPLVRLKLGLCRRDNCDPLAHW